MQTTPIYGGVFTPNPGPDPVPINITDTKGPDMASIIPVYIIKDDINYTPERVEHLFTSPIFKVIKEDVLIPPKIITAVSNNDARSKMEAYRVLMTLQDARTKYPNLPVLVIKDTSVSHVSPDYIANQVSGTLSRFYQTGQSDFHCFYLSKWLDKCHLYTEQKLHPHNSTMVVRTQSPQGIQAILFTPVGRDILLCQHPMLNSKLLDIDKALGTKLPEEIFAGNIIAYCAVPNLVDFDINSALSNQDFHKLSQCEVMVSPSSGPKEKSRQVIGTIPPVNNGISPIVWFLLIVAIIILLLWASKSGKLVL